MSKKKKKREYDGHFAGIDEKVMEAEAWKGLKASTKWLYFEYKYRFYGDNEHNIIFTYKEAKEIMSENTFIKDRNQLIERGFIDVIRRGGLEKQPIIYGLSNRWKKYGTEEFIEVKIKDILPRMYKERFKRGHEFMGNRYKKKGNL